MSEQSKFQQPDFNPETVLSRYQQAQALAQGVLTNQLVLNDAVFPHWIVGHDTFWYIRSTRQGRQYRLVDAKRATNLPAFDHQALAQALLKATGQNVDPENLPLQDIEIKLLPVEIHFSALDKHWIFKPDNLLSVHKEKSTIPNGSLISPDRKKAVFTRNHNLWMVDLNSGKEHYLTQDGTEKFYYARAAAPWGWPTTPDLQAVWSPDSQSLLTYQLDRRHIKSVPIVQHVPQDGSLHPQLTEHCTTHTGDKEIETYHLIAINAETGEIQKANYHPLPLYRQGPGFFTYEGFGWWANDSRRAFFVDISRGAQSVQLVELDTHTGETRVLFEETSSTFVKLSHEQVERPVFLPLLETEEVIWFSERSGWGHLYLYDLKTGKLKYPLTEGEWLVRNILHCDIQQRELLIQTAARDGNINPYYRDICRLNIDTKNLIPLATGNYEHVAFDQNEMHVTAVSSLGLEQADTCGVSSSGNYLVATRSRVNTLPVSLLINRDGREIMTLETADPVSLPEDWIWPEPIKLKSADGQTDLYGVIYRPPGFSPEYQYPVLDFSNAHPGCSFVPHAAFTSGAFFGDPYLIGAAYAALGFVVVAIETLGMPKRQKAFQDASYGRIASVNHFHDRIAGLQQLAKNYSEIDLDRVGIVGYDGMTGPVYGLLEHPEFYKVGVAIAFQDSRFEIASTVEIFEGVSSDQTNKPHAESLAASLQGELLLIHGMMDPTTPVTGTFRLIEALQQANKDFDLLLLPSGGHDISTYALRRSWDYVVRHLQGVEPPKNFKLATAWDILC